MLSITSELQEKVVGYSALSRLDYKYITVDGATYVANTIEDMLRFIDDSLLNREDYLIDKETVADLLHDYGDTRGVYALEIGALDKFSSVADIAHLHYNKEPYESFDSEEPDLFIVEIEE